MLSARQIRKTYPTRSGGLSVLVDVSLELAAGESAAIMGPSGSGKSTLLNILGTLEPPSSGTLLIGDQEPLWLEGDALSRFRNRAIGFIFQDHHLLPQCSALENVLLPTLAGETDAAAPDRARDLLARVGLSERLDHRPAELSGGERQRVAIARALINKPRVLLADEPTGNLDRKTADTVAELLDELHAGSDFVMIVVTHSPALASRYVRRWELVDGRLAGG
ncbi:MAG: ABC transporter ATP-binding protein [Phycisphaerales bacterium]|nr:ABC transporter ATP-binding protein [Phycisphaerales bacterium]